MRPPHMRLAQPGGGAEAAVSSTGWASCRNEPPTRAQVHLTRGLASDIILAPAL